MENNSLRKRILKGTFAAASEQIVNIVAQLVMVPLFISKWGIPLYGEWLLLFTFPAYLTMSDFGFAKAAVNSMTLNYAINDIKKVNQYYQSCFVLISLISLIILTFTLLIPYLIPLNSALNISIINSRQIFLVLFFLIVYVLLTQQSELLAGVICSAGFFSDGMMYATLYRLIEFVCVSCALFLNKGVVEIAACYMVVRFIKVLHLYLIIRSRFKWLEFGFSATKTYASKQYIKEMTKPAMAFMLLPVGNALRNQLPIFLLGIFLTPASIVIFTTIRTIVNMGTQFIGLVTKALTPEYAIAYAKNDYTTLRNIYLKSSNIAFWLSILISIGILLSANLLLKFWLHNKIIMNYHVLIIFLLSLIANSLWTTASFLSYSINQHSRQSIYFVFSCILSGIFTFFIVKSSGLNYSASGIFFGDVIMCLLVIKLNNVTINSTNKYFLENLSISKFFNNFESFYKNKLNIRSNVF